MWSANQIGVLPTSHRDPRNLCMWQKIHDHFVTNHFRSSEIKLKHSFYMTLCSVLFSHTRGWAGEVVRYSGDTERWDRETEHHAGQHLGTGWHSGCVVIFLDFRKSLHVLKCSLCEQNCTCVLPKQAWDCLVLKCLSSDGAGYFTGWHTTSLSPSVCLSVCRCRF